MKIFITGITGFIGRHLAEQFIRDGHEVWGLARSAAKLSSLQLNIHPIIGEISSQTSFSFLKDLPDDLDTVIHAAGLVHSHNTNDFYRSNFEGPQFFFNQLAKMFAHRDIFFINFSSQAAIGPSIGSSASELATERTLPHPVDHYGKSKLLFEDYLQESRPDSWQIINGSH